MSQPEPAPAGQRPGAAGRPARADARRNREKLITAARAAFAAAPGGQVALEAIASQAGVGTGTLYRHFPTREALIEAVHAAELDDVTASASVLLGRFPPDVALRAWMDRYATFWETKHAMLGTLRAGSAPGRISPSTRERVITAITPILACGAEAGLLRADVRPDDVAGLLLGVFLSTAASGTPEEAGRLLDLVVDALRPQDAGTTEDRASQEAPADRLSP
ncbi:TetR/AcrR family transcriptional regulator [Actinoallomurus rhizosphaericola]|uniref:TetR/AcrR family transcriptional regulator n=1 Tax=Actinoallomurus rhizosphaericola TaxID=2952536 RepID=UPI00209310F9|nr:TetR/AcrR family transcriptional regulator [Actinoallomurus rhizosphaericola]MCO5997655.1 TetR/AcrR family transcriptional regulator [Actinoallomurus rhizosphaericola]